MDESRIGQYSISVTTYPIMALEKLIYILTNFVEISKYNSHFVGANIKVFVDIFYSIGKTSTDLDYIQVEV